MLAEDASNGRQDQSMGRHRDDSAPYKAPAGVCQISSVWSTSKEARPWAREPALRSAAAERRHRMMPGVHRIMVQRRKAIRKRR